MSESEASKFITDIIASNAEALFNVATRFFSDKTNQIKARLTSTFSRYLYSIEKKYSSTKTIIYRDTPQLIKQFYEPIDLFNNKYEFKSPKIDDLLALNHPIIIIGTGGSGKSTLLKYLLLNTLEYTKKIPFFVELRVVEKEGKTLLEYLANNLELNRIDLPQEYLTLAFEKGNFIFFLDGFDELSQEFAQRMSLEIENLSQRFSNCNFIITSRPGQEYISWSNFIELKTKPLTVDKAVNLITRLDYDEDVKANFLNELKRNLYNSHQSFFENPLLLSIMLITFRDTASIPSELHNFYALAFEALYYRHDASKAFKRPTLTSLPINKGKDILAAFSLISYIDNQTLFSYYELKGLLEQSIKITDCECNIDSLITDLQRAYCMLIQDGTKYQYTHRSFQEYFAAYFLVNTNEANQHKLIQQFCLRASTDLTLQLAYGMNSKMLEEKLIIPFLKDMRNTINYENEVSKDVFIRFAHVYFNSVSFFHDKQISLSINNPNTSQVDNDKFLKLSITKLILTVYNVNLQFNFKKDGFKRDIPDGLENKGTIEINMEQAFTDENLLNWFVYESLEARVLKELMNIERRLITKNKEASDFFRSLLENKNQALSSK